MTGEMFFEDFVVGVQRETTGRTITEADVVLHAGQTGDFYPHHIDAGIAGAVPSRLDSGWRTAHWSSVLPWA